MKQMVSQAREAEQKAKGVLEELTRRLKEDWDCETVEDAEELLDKKQKQAEKMLAVAEAKMEEFKEAWDEWRANDESV